MLLLQRTEDYTHAAVERILGGEILRNALKVCARLLDADAWFQSSDGAPPARAALAFTPYCGGSSGLVWNERSPDLDFALCSVTEQFGNFAGYHSDNRVRFV